MPPTTRETVLASVLASTDEALLGKHRRSSRSEALQDLRCSVALLDPASVMSRCCFAILRSPPVARTFLLDQTLRFWVRAGALPTELTAQNLLICRHFYRNLTTYALPTFRTSRRRSIHSRRRPPRSCPLAAAVSSPLTRKGVITTPGNSRRNQSRTAVETSCLSRRRPI